ncbi:MAG: hypothetical protein AAGU32_10795 [Bacillota bacterium]
MNQNIFSLWGKPQDATVLRHFLLPKTMSVAKGQNSIFLRYEKQPERAHNLLYHHDILLYNKKDVNRKLTILQQIRPCRKAFSSE